MIFSETVGKKRQFTSPVYVYKAHFLVSYFRYLNFELSHVIFLKVMKKLVKTLCSS